MEFFAGAWGFVCDLCKARITEVAYTIRIHRIRPVSLDFNKEITVPRVPNRFHLQTLTRCYTPLFQKVFSEVFGEGVQVQLCAPGQLAQNRKPDTVPLSKDGYEYTFDIFIVGPSDRFTHAASMAVVTKLAVLYNPLPVYGDSGLGRTHLLYAIRNEISKSYPQMNIICIKGDEFTSELIETIRRGTTVELHQCYRETDILLVDGVQFITGRDPTQEEFFHTFSMLCKAKKQTVLIPDRPPKDIATLKERLLTHSEQGLTTDVQLPDFEARIATIKGKAELFGIDLPDSVAEYITSHLRNNIRQFKDTVKKMKAYYLLAGETLSVSTAQTTTSDITNSHQFAPMAIEEITEKVVRTLGTPPEGICSPKRSTNVSSTRQVAMYMVREITQLPIVFIGRAFDDCDHSTVVYATQRVEKSIGRDPRTYNTTQNIVKNIHD